PFRMSEADFFLYLIHFFEKWIDLLVTSTFMLGSVRRQRRMEYTVKKLAQLAGVSARTLRNCDEIAILKPARVSEAGYRIYEEAQVNRLQQIMFYRELGFPLETIRNILQLPDFDELEALKQHRAQLLDE